MYTSQLHLLLTKMHLNLIIHCTKVTCCVHVYIVIQLLLITSQLDFPITAKAGTQDLKESFYLTVPNTLYEKTGGDDCGDLVIVSILILPVNPVCFHFHLYFHNHSKIDMEI